jgi:hypothetical protein
MIMRGIIGTALLGGVLLLSVAPCKAWAQAAPAPANTQAAVQQRIQMLKTQLAITPQQEPLWEAFAAKMEENATVTGRLAEQRSAALASMNAVDNMRSYARIAHEYANNADRLTAAFATLYAALSPVQRQAADVLLRQQQAPATPTQ